MYGDFSWADDIVPQIEIVMANGLVRGALIAIVSLSMAVWGAQGLISVFKRRD